MLAHVGDQIAKLPTEIRDQLTTTGKIEGRLRRLDALDPDIDSTPAGAYRLAWLLTSSIRTRLHVARSGALSASSMNSSTNTAPPCVKNLVSVLSRQQHWL